MQIPKCFSKTSMRILGTRVMNGPNYWSGYRKKLIVVTLDLGELENSPTNKIKGFRQRLEVLLPSLHTHRCSEDHEGGFFKRVEESTWLGHVIEHIALEIQTLAGMECGFGRTRSTEKTGVYTVLFSYEIKEAGLYAAEAAFNIANALVKGEPYDVKKDIEELKYIRSRYGLGPSTKAIVDEAVKRNIPYRRLSRGSHVVFGYGCKQKSIRATITGKTSNIGVDIASDKERTKELLSNAYIPVPSGTLIYSAEELPGAINKIGFPVVVKPINGNHGRGITTNVINNEKALEAFHIAKTVSSAVIIEKFIEGYDYRLLLVNYKLVAAAKRTPALVVGNGISTIKELIKEVNKDPNRGDGHEKIMTKIKADQITRQILRKGNYSLSAILPIGEVLFLKDTANMSTGGTSTDVTDEVHPSTVFMAERVARILDLDICGIDVVAQDITSPLADNNGGIVEVNAAPGLRMHLYPSKGIGRNVAEPIMEMMFPKNETGRIPIIAVTGTNGKTTTTRLVAFMAMKAGYKVGYTTTEGIYINENPIHMGDCTGPISTQTILAEPSVELAVLECARGGILRSGLAFDKCNISIITNVTEDHLGLNGINNLKELAQVKSVVAKSTFDDGYSILNADDDIVYEMRNDVDCNIALFSIHPNNKRVIDHCKSGGLAAFIDKGYLVISKGEWKMRIEKIKSIPLTLNGTADCMIKNVLPAVLAGIIQGFNLETIRSALLSFIPSPELTPGRMNIFDFRDFKVMIDYAHNADGLSDLKKFIKQIKAPRKIVLVAATGDRRDQDIRNIGKICAEIFDELIIKHDRDLRGRTADNITGLLMEGINTVGKKKVQVISNEKEAFLYALSIATPGTFITLLADRVFEAIEYVKQSHLEIMAKTDVLK
jgi:cyanophycin synthetase